MVKPPLKLINFSTDREEDLHPELYYFDEVEADRWCNFIETYCTHTDGDLTGEPIVLSWFWRRVIREVFGTKRRSDGLRRYMYVIIFVPRKNFKSGMISSFNLGLTSIDRPGTRKQNYILASTEEQAFRTFKMSQQMVKQNQFLSKYFDVTDEGIIHVPSGSILKALSSAPKGKTGSIPHSITWDEQQEQTSDKLISAMETGLVSQLDPLVFRIGTGGDTPDKELPGYREFLLGRDILNGVKRLDNHYVVIAEAPEDCDPGDKAIWAAVNPLWNESVNERVIASIYEKALDSPKLMQEFKQYHLNIWQQKSSAFLPDALWEKCVEDYTEEDLLGQECYGGLDLGGDNDMSAFYLLFPFWSFEEEVDDESGKMIKVPKANLKQLVWYWTPESTREDNDSHGIPYSEWESKELLEITKGDTVDRPLIRRRILALKKRFKILQIGYDRWRAQEMAQLLQDRHKVEMVDIAQVVAVLSEPTALFRELVKSRLVAHNNNDVFNFNLKCARTISNVHEDEMISTKHSRGDNGRGKVDGLSAAMNAWKLFIMAPPPKPKRRILVVG